MRGLELLIFSRIYLTKSFYCILWTPDRAWLQTAANTPHRFQHDLYRLGGSVPYEDPYTDASRVCIYMRIKFHTISSKSAAITRHVPNSPLPDKRCRSIPCMCMATLLFGQSQPCSNSNVLWWHWSTRGSSSKLVRADNEFARLPFIPSFNQF